MSVKHIFFVLSLSCFFHCHAVNRHPLPPLLPASVPIVSPWATPDNPLWPKAKRETRAGSRWWWPGSSIDHENLVWLLDEYRKAGLGTLEITPIYGIKGNEKNELSFLSPGWMAMLADVQREAESRDMDINMDCGTGWPFGGPEVSIDEAACKAVFVDTLIHAKAVNADDIDLPAPVKEKPYARLQCKRAFKTAEPDTWRVIAVYASRTLKKVERAAPGGEGLVIDHFDSTAVANYLKRFDRAFEASGTPFPHTMFNDSYEVERADWTPGLFDEFYKRRGYRLEDKLPELLGYVDDGNNTLADYRETLSDLLYDNFTKQWTAWAHSHGMMVRSQAHGSPANLLDLYAAVDIPEIEGFGLSDFGIKGLRKDIGKTRRNQSDMSMLKYASSAAHVMGKPYTSSETFTWLTEHFRTSLSQMKPDLDLMLTCGVNRVFFHGTCYSPKDDQWPGWKFYASVDMSPTNSIWRDAPYLMRYIDRAQRFMQMGKPDNDFLVYLPVGDMWHKRLDGGASGLFMQFGIGSMGKKSAEFIGSVLRIDSLGYDCDYISDRQLAKTVMSDGCLLTEGGTRYKAVIIPTGTTITPELYETLKKFPGKVVYGESGKKLAEYAKPEAMRHKAHLRAIRRRNETGYHYFIANLTPEDIDTTVPLAVEYVGARWFNPMDGSVETAQTSDGKIHIRMRSGESRILQTYDTPVSDAGTACVASSQYSVPSGEDISLRKNVWKLSFTDEMPRVGHSFVLDSLQTWEKLDSLTGVTMGTGVYETTVRLSRKQAQGHWIIDLGDVRESARVYINNTYIGCAWAVPFTLDCMNTLRRGRNTIRIEVTNLPANRIADMDRKDLPWRKMKEINFVDINYKNTKYGKWEPVESGLNSDVRLIRLTTARDAVRQE